MEQKEVVKEIKIVEISHKHLFRKNEKGEIDNWTFDNEYHNGPFCVKCCERFCEHCQSEKFNEDCSEVHYVADDGKIYMEISDKSSD